MSKSNCFQFFFSHQTSLWVWLLRSSTDCPRATKIKIECKNVVKRGRKLISLHQLSPDTFRAWLKLRPDDFPCMWLFSIYKSLDDDINHIIACIQEKDIFAFQLLRDFLCFSIRQMCNTFFSGICCVSFFFTFISFDSPIFVECFLLWWWRLHMLFDVLIELSFRVSIFDAFYLGVEISGKIRQKKRKKKKQVWKFNSFQLHFRLTSSGGRKICKFEIWMILFFIINWHLIAIQLFYQHVKMMLQERDKIFNNREEFHHECLVVVRTIFLLNRWSLRFTQLSTLN